MIGRLTFDKYLDESEKQKNSPTDKRAFRAFYKSKYAAIMEKQTNGRLEYTVYKDTKSKTGNYYVYIKIPSESLDNFYYDVVVQLYTKGIQLEPAQSLKSYDVKFFSNDPAFTYAFIRGRVYIEDLKPKLLKRDPSMGALLKAANPSSKLTHVKSLHYAYLFMNQMGLFDRSTLDRAAKPYDKRELLARVKSAEDKYAERQVIQQEQKKNKPAAPKQNRNQNISTKSSVTSKSSTATRKTKTVKNTKTTKTVKSTASKTRGGKF